MTIYYYYYSCIIELEGGDFAKHEVDLDFSLRNNSAMANPQYKAVLENFDSLVKTIMQLLEH